MKGNRIHTALYQRHRLVSNFQGNTAVTLWIFITAKRRYNTNIGNGSAKTQMKTFIRSKYLSISCKSIQETPLPTGNSAQKA